VTVSERAIHLGLLVSALAVTGWAFATHGERAPNRPAIALPASGQSSLLSLIPPGSAFVLSADVPELARAPLGAFLAQRLGHASGAGQLSALCGFEPLTRLDQLALAVPSATLAAQEHPEDFGIVASGRFSAKEIAHCASAAITARSGEPIQTQLGSFSSVRDRKHDGGEVAARDGLLLVSGGSYFRQLLDAAEGNAPASEHRDARDARHAELRRTLGSAPLLATWLLGQGWFERIAQDERGARLSPLRTLEAVGARIDVAGAIHVTLLLECADSDGASGVSSLLGELRSSLKGLPLDPALTGLAERIAVSQTGARLRLTLELSQAELTPLLDLLLGPA
jgi:hypothetical protein